MSNIKIKKLGKIELLVIATLLVAFTATQFITPTIATQVTTQTAGEEIPVKSANLPYPMSSTVYLGSFTERKLIPIIIIYDPPGRQSYQEVIEGTTTTFSVNIEANMAGVYGGGSFDSSASISTTYKSSTETDYSTGDVGPGKGDRIVCKLFELTYGVYEVFEGPGPLYATNTESIYFYAYQHYTAVVLRSVTEIDSIIAVSRRLLEYNYSVIVENRTNTPGKDAAYILFSPDTPTDRIVELSIKAGFSFGVDVESETGIPMIPKIKFRFTLTFSGAHSYTVKVHFEDNISIIETYMNADVYFNEITPDEYAAGYWTFWFNTTWQE